MSTSAQLVLSNVVDYHYPWFPARAETNKLVSFSGSPFGVNWDGSRWAASRYQQVYNASLFSNLPPGGHFIAEMYVRPGCGGREDSNITNMVVRMSTTLRKAGELSPVFDENLGDDTLDVRAASPLGINGGIANFFCDVPGSSGALAPISGIRFLQPYFYDPRKGNLLVDMLIPVHDTSEPRASSAGKVFRIEVSAGLADGMSSIEAPGVNPTRATQTNQFGMVTGLWMGGFPKLVPIPTGDVIRLYWPYVPEPCRLQYKDDPRPEVPWLNHDSVGLRTDQVVQRMDIPRASLPARRYFRLYWNSPQLGLPDTPIEVTRDMPPTPPQP